MPKILEEAVRKIKAKGNLKKGSNPWAIATAALQKAGKLKKGTHKLSKKRKQKLGSNLKTK